MSAKIRWLLGNLKGTLTPVYIYDFSWDCGWYWGGGYIGNSNFHSHFDGAFLETIDSRGHCLNSRGATFLDPWQEIPKYTDPKNVRRVSNGCSVWEDLGFFLDDPKYNKKQWWRIKDLFKQFYTLKKAAEVFRHGGHCTSDGRTPEEIVPEMTSTINKHIGAVIIPLIRKELNTPVAEINSVDNP
jgi:hypothetical protein